MPALCKIPAIAEVPPQSSDWERTNGLTERWMHDQSGLIDVHMAAFRPSIQNTPVNALMWTLGVGQGNWVRRAPFHSHERSVPLTHDSLAKHIETVN